MSKIFKIRLCAKTQFDLRWNMTDVSPRVFCKSFSYKVNLLVSHSTKDKQVLYILNAVIVASHNLRPARVWSCLIACFVTGNWQNCVPSRLFCLWPIRDFLVWAVLRLCPEYQMTWSFPVFVCLTDERIYSMCSLCFISVKQKICQILDEMARLCMSKLWWLDIKWCTVRFDNVQ